MALTFNYIPGYTIIPIRELNTTDYYYTIILLNNSFYLIIMKSWGVYSLIVELLTTSIIYEPVNVYCKPGPPNIINILRSSELGIALC